MLAPLRDLDLASLRRRTSLKWRHYPADVLPMWVAEMDSSLAAPIAQALTEAITHGDTGYAVGADYTDALAGFAARRWGWQIDTGHTAIVPDVMLGIVEVLKLVTQPGAEVVVNPPVYPPFYMFLGSMGLTCVNVGLTAEGRLNLDALDAAFRRTKTYLLCNPHNPTGTVHTRDELAAVAELARQHRVRVVVDEIHAPLVLPGANFVPYLSVPGAQTALSVMSASKAWNLAGIKAALAIAGDEAAADLARMPEEVSHGTSHLGVIAHVAALRHGEQWLDGLLSNLDDNRRLLGELLTRHLPQVSYRPPQATYLAWLDCRQLGLGDDPAAVFLDRGRVALNSGPLFGPGGAGHVRMNIGTSPELIAEGVHRMARAEMTVNDDPESDASALTG